jgi:hypothetical protein
MDYAFRTKKPIEVHRRFNASNAFWILERGEVDQLDGNKLPVHCGFVDLFFFKRLQPIQSQL